MTGEIGETEDFNGNKEINEERSGCDGQSREFEKKKPLTAEVKREKRVRETERWGVLK